MAAKYRENPSRTIKQVRRHGLFVAFWLAAVCALEGAMISIGIGGYANPWKIALALVTVGVLFTLPKLATVAQKKNLRQH